MCEGSIIAKCFEIDKFDKYIGVLFLLCELTQLFLYLAHLPMNELLLVSFVAALPDVFNQETGLLGKGLGDFAVIEQKIHSIL